MANKVKYNLGCNSAFNQNLTNYKLVNLVLVVFNSALMKKSTPSKKGEFCTEFDLNSPSFGAGNLDRSGFN